ncbi:MAG TPA: PilZ domain-containing protein [Terriglobia bacterium]|nr:PilZ domain-containing protein [Terriglobia bacterium]
MVRDPLTVPELEKQTNNKVRAQRFILQVPLRYRATGDDLWRRGETENISSSGLLFTGEHFVKSNALVEICLRMPVVTAGIAAEVVCRCVIVRAVHQRDVDHPPVLAAKILHFRLVRP